MTSKTADLDVTIVKLNDMLAKAKGMKDKLLITDRLLRCYSIKYKYSDEGQGGKFASPDNGAESPPIHTT